MSPTPSPPELSAALRAARDTAVVCDLESLSVIAIDGPDAPAFLQGQLSNDVHALAADRCQYTSHNSPKGRMLANFVLWRDDGPRYCALLPGELADAVRKRLSLYVLRSRVTLRDASADTVRMGVGGPGAEAALRAALDVVPGVFGVARKDGATILGLPGPRYCVMAGPDRAGEIRGRLLASASAAPFAVWQWLTIRAGVPVVTAATQDLFVAQSANLDVLGGVDFKKGCYTGQEIIARMQYLGRLKERLFAFHAPVEAVASGARLYSSAFAGQPCGTVVNAAPAPGGGTDLTAVLQVAAAESGDVRLDGDAGPRLDALPLPYALPAPAPAPGRHADLR
jgi:folate-binding protein YgfZ